MAVDRSRERNAGDRGNGGRLRGTTTLAIAAGRRRRVPNLLAGIETQREHPAAFFRIDVGAEAIRNDDASQIGQRDIDIGAVRCRAPLHATISAALTHTNAPDLLALIVGIDGVYEA